MAAFFYDGTVKTAPIQLFRADHMTTRNPHMKFPGYERTQEGYRVILDLPQPGGEPEHFQECEMVTEKAVCRW